MKNVIFDEQRELTQLGYRMVERKDNKKALLLKGKKILARFESSSEGEMTVKISGYLCSNIDNVNIRKATKSENVIVELYHSDADSCDEPLWCEILAEGNLRIL